MHEPPPPEEASDPQYVRTRDFCENEIGLEYRGESPPQLRYACRHHDDRDDDKGHLYVNYRNRKWYCHKCPAGGGSLFSLADEMVGTDGVDQIMEAARERMREVFRTKKPLARATPRLLPVPSPHAAVVPTPHQAEILEATAAHCQAALGGDVLDYLKTRVSEASILTYRFGTVPPDLADHLIKSRGFDAAECVAVGVVREHWTGHRPHWEGAVVIPFFRSGVVENILYRLAPEDEGKYGRYRALRHIRRGLFNADLLSTGGTVFITEGVFDCISLLEQAYPAIGLPSVNLSADHAAELARFETVFTVFDNDAAADVGRERAAHRLHGKRVLHVRLPAGVKDVNDYFRKHGGTKEAFDLLVAAAKAAATTTARTEKKPSTKAASDPAPERLPLLSEEWPALERAIRRRGEMEGMKTGFVKLDRLLSGLQGLIVLGGQPGVGKTTLALQLGWEAAVRNGALLVVVSLEMQLSRVVMRILSRLAETEAKALILSEVHGSKKFAEAKKKLLSLGGSAAFLDDVAGGRESLHTRIEATVTHARAKSAVVIVDSLQYLADRWFSARDPKERLDRTVQGLSIITNIPESAVLAISHKPKAQWERHELNSFLGSAGIAYGVDAALMLEKDGAPMPEGSDAPMMLHVIKNRSGPEGKVRLQFNRMIGSFVEV